MKCGSRVALSPAVGDVCSQSWWERLARSQCIPSAAVPLPQLFLLTLCFWLAPPFQGPKSWSENTTEQWSVRAGKGLGRLLNPHPHCSNEGVGSGKGSTIKLELRACLPIGPTFSGSRGACNSDTAFHCFQAPWSATRRKRPTK